MGAVEEMSPFPVADSSETTPPWSAEADVWLRPKACIGQLSKEFLGRLLEGGGDETAGQKTGKRFSSKAKRFVMAYLGREANHRLTCPEAAYR
jgi:hypothetical protein